MSTIVVINGTEIRPDEVRIIEGVKSYYTRIKRIPNMVIDLDTHINGCRIFRIDGLDDRCLFVEHPDGHIDAFDVIVDDEGSITISELVKNKDDVLVKHRLLEYMKNPPEPTTARNRMGCSENWYDSFYAISQTFTVDQIEHMSEVAVFNLVKLAENIQEALY